MTQTPIAAARPDEVKATSSTVEEQKIALVGPECGECQLTNGRNKRPQITVIQTADPTVYGGMLMESAVTTRLFCEHHRIEYKQFIGIKRGYFPWHACFNRIVMIHEMLEEGYNGWVFYLDADAFIADLKFDIYRLLSLHSGSMLASPGGLTGERWDINDGVFLLDLGSEVGRKIALLWYNDFMSTTDDQLKAAMEWQDVPSDQPRLHRILRARPELCAQVMLIEREILNHQEGVFVRQILRSNAPTIEERRRRIAEQVATITQVTSDVITGHQALSAPYEDVITRKILGKEIKSSQYGKGYISEFRRIIETYVDKDAKHFLEWGTGYTTVVMAEIAARNGAGKLVTIDTNAKYMEEFVLPFAHEGFLDARALSIDGPCVNDRDTGLNYTSYPLSLGIKFDFIFIDGRRRIECAFISSLLSHDLTIIVIHDYRRLRYQSILALFDLIEDGTQFRVLKRRRSLSAQIDERFQLVIGSMKPALPPGSA